MHGGNRRKVQRSLPALTKDALEAAHCWEADDRVPGRPEMTEFRRKTRYHQARWREAHGHPIGSQPIAAPLDGRPVRLVGSRLPLAYGRETGANFFSRVRWQRRRPARRSSNRTRASITSDCGPTCCRRRRWRSTCSATWPPTSSAPTGPSRPGGRTRPARCARSASRTRRAGSIPPTSTASAPSTRRSCSTFGDGTQGIVGVDTKYHERVKSRDPEADQPLALPGGRRAVGRLRAGCDRRGQGTVGCWP